MHYEKSYKNMTQEEADNKAVQDVREYLSDKQWEALVLLRDAGNPNAVAMGLSIAGIQGYPVHAIIRVFMPEKYQECYNSLPD